MATTLINTRKSILGQIHTSWNKWRNTEEAKELFPKGAPTSEEMGKNTMPWYTKQSVLERLTVHANKLIRLYISLNICVADRKPVWKFFEVQSGVVGTIKDEITTLKRVQKVKKMEQELLENNVDGVKESNATDLFKFRTDIQPDLNEVEANLKYLKKDSIKKAKAQAKAYKKETKSLRKQYLKAAKGAAKFAAKKIAKVEKAKAKAISKEAAQRKKWLEKIDAQNYGIQFDRENSSIETLKRICREIPKCKAADKKLAKKDTKEAELRKKREARSIKVERKASKTVEELEKKLDKLIKWCGNNDVPMDDAIAMLKLKL